MTCVPKKAELLCLSDGKKFDANWLANILLMQGGGLAAKGKHLLIFCVLNSSIRLFG